MINTVEEFKLLFDRDDHTALAHQTAPPKVWNAILDNHPQLARCVAANKTIPDEIIERLSLSHDIDVRWNIATKRKLKKSTFELLATDSDPTIRHRIACNPKTPRDILQRLSIDPDPMVASSATQKLAN
ncbi:MULTISPECIES: hypothetical protein [Pseudomonas]|uniref:hypothetical protein n=1 Tax=Pseudomonas TaxID=286 RepID=UPI000F7AE565|nr:MULTISPECIES: hypothetical protein [Pseudomonas]MBA1209800.1 hypothetical protein [Pseudomonas fulva]MBA1219241.1 hypothetical protein [Pseudomonas fulva]MDH0574325.1 hypothetical protein [Pseudomonas fulva]MDI3374755.1 hypothetical protein [Pseudomonas sp. V104_6]